MMPTQMPMQGQAQAPMTPEQEAQLMFLLKQMQQPRMQGAMAASSPQSPMAPAGGMMSMGGFGMGQPIPDGS